jgi:hypothetical protein
MTDTPFVATLRSRPDTIDMSVSGTPSITIRAQLASAWDAVRITVSPTESLSNVKLRALEALDPGADAPGEYMVTHRGVRILDEDASLADAGVVNAATLFIAHRHRQPVR